MDQTITKEGYGTVCYNVNIFTEKYLKFEILPMIFIN